MLMNETAFPFHRVVCHCFFVSGCSQYRQIFHSVWRKIIFCLSEVQESTDLFMKKLNYSWSHLGDYFQLHRCGMKRLIWPPSPLFYLFIWGSYRAQILVLHLLEFGVSVASTQLHISQNHLEHSVVNSLGEVHVKLIHRCLKREKGKQKKRIIRITWLRPSAASHPQHENAGGCASMCIL